MADGGEGRLQMSWLGKLFGGKQAEPKRRYTAWVLSGEDALRVKRLIDALRDERHKEENRFHLWTAVKEYVPERVRPGQLRIIESSAMELVITDAPSEELPTVRDVVDSDVLIVRAVKQVVGGGCVAKGMEP